jgi:hypothetical protein
VTASDSEGELLVYQDPKIGAPPLTANGAFVGRLGNAGQGAHIR